jgi:hypothetical protein
LGRIPRRGGREKGSLLVGGERAERS